MVVSGTRRNKEAREIGCVTVGGSVGILNRVVKKSLTETVTLEQRCKRSGKSCEAL